MCQIPLTGSCDVQEMTFVGLQTSVHHQTPLQQGQRYFLTIEATNAAGLKESAYSDGVTVDTTPAQIGDVVFDVGTSAANAASQSPPPSESGRDRRSVWDTPADAGQTDAFAVRSDSAFGSEQQCRYPGNGSCNFLKQTNPWRLAFSWRKLSDAESGVSSIEWCAGNRPKFCDFVSWSVVDPSATSVEHSLSKPLPSGSKVIVTLKITNGVKMVSTSTSKPLLIDSTAPIPGTVIVGNTPEIKYLKKDESVQADWSGFIDHESGLSHFEWAVCYASSTRECITPFINIGLKKSIDNSGLDIKPGVSYVLVVRAHNNAGLYSEAISNSFTLDDSLPTAGTVYDGLRELSDLDIQSSSREISANWSPFTDTNGRITVYEMCVGTEQEKCDVNDFVTQRIALKGTISGLTLEHDEKYFVTVRATNEAGYSAIASSNGIQVDSTPPVSGSVIDTDGRELEDIDYQPDGTYIYASWDGFEDEESGIVRYRWCAGTAKGTCDIIPETDLGDVTNLVERQISPALATGMVVFVTVSAFNGAGGVTRESSNGVKVDSTGPVISEVGNTLRLAALE